MKITFVISSLGCGGAERALTAMANAFAEGGDRVTILSLDDGRNPPFFSLNGGVRHIPLGLAGLSANFFVAMKKNIDRVCALRKVIVDSSPDRIISFLDITNLLTLLATRGVNVPVIVSERIDPRHHPKEWYWRFLRSRLYPYADAVIVQTEHAKNFFPQRIQKKTVVIPNAMSLVSSPDTLDSDILKPLPGLKILSVGRLERQKRHDLTIDALSRLPLDASLIIVGKGSLRASLEHRARQKDVHERVRFLEEVKDLSDLYRQADLFVLASDFEGFPNVLIEAMASGLPAIATATAGSTDIIQSGVNGVLISVNDGDTLAREMERLLKNEAERRKLGHEATKIKERYSVEKIHEAWKSVIRNSGVNLI